MKTRAPLVAWLPISILVALLILLVLGYVLMT